MSVDTARRSIDWIFAHVPDYANAVEISFIGGEPLLDFSLIKEITQTFSVRFNIVTWQIGRVWGDRYKSKILPGDPPESAAMLFSSVAVFFAAAPWRGIQATPQAQQKVVPVSGDGLGGVEMMSRKEIAEFIAYKLSRGCPRGAGRGKKAGDSPKCTFSVSSGRNKKRQPAPSAA